MKSLGAATFVWNGNIQDYCYKETILCLTELSNEISIRAGGNDGTWEDVVKLINSLIDKHPDKKFIYSRITQEEWDSQHGREKLSYFSNQAIEELLSDYTFYLQCDEIIDPDSYHFIWSAIQTGEEGFLVRRINMWFDPYSYLHVPHERQPCGQAIVRLAKHQYRCIDDAESLFVPHQMQNLTNLIVILHLGFVRDKVKHMTKIRNIQGQIFQIEVDKKCDGMEVFDPSKWFSREDVTKYEKPLPPLIQPWVDERYPELKP